MRVTNVLIMAEKRRSLVAARLLRCGRATSPSKLVFLVGAAGFVSLLSVLAVDTLGHFSAGGGARFASSSEGFEVNNWGDNNALLVKVDRQRDAPDSEMKTILMWNDAYGVRNYDIGHGREPFYKFRCPETRCIATANRSLLSSVDQFDALLIHQRGIEWDDMPKRRSPRQRWVHWVMESQQYLYMDIHKLDGLFNWTMTFKRNSDFYLPYGRFFQVKELPAPLGSKELEAYIKAFGRRNRHLAGGRKDAFQAAWFVSHCATVGRRERYAKALGKYMDVHVYGKCGRHKCSRDNETACYEQMAADYRFYLSFENSICDDYITEKFFNILQYDVIPVAYGGSNMSALAPPRSHVNAMDFGSPAKLARHLRALQEDDARFAEHFWWRDFYEVRASAADRAQPYCDLCARLHDEAAPPKVYGDMHAWWVSDSHCRKLRTSNL